MVPHSGSGIAVLNMNQLMCESYSAKRGGSQASGVEKNHFDVDGIIRVLLAKATNEGRFIEWRQIISKMYAK